MSTHEPLSEERLAEIRTTLSDEEGMSDLAYRFTSQWASVRFKGDLAQAALDLQAEVERMRAEMARMRPILAFAWGDVIRGLSETGCGCWTCVSAREVMTQEQAAELLLSEQEA